jgi:hypothetical protein
MMRRQTRWIGLGPANPTSVRRPNPPAVCRACNPRCFSYLRAASIGIARCLNRPFSASIGLPPCYPLLPRIGCNIRSAASNINSLARSAGRREWAREACRARGAKGSKGQQGAQPDGERDRSRLWAAVGRNTYSEPPMTQGGRYSTRRRATRAPSRSWRRPRSRSRPRRPNGEQNAR